MSFLQTFKFLSFLFVTSLFCTITLAQEVDSITINKPPQSIGDWYKPKNKRQVWLHTMFRLRRELLAISDYGIELQSETKLSAKLSAKQKDLLNKWFNSFKKDYRSISTMVPQWNHFVETELVKQLDSAIKEQQYRSIPLILNKLKNSCDNCHGDYQAVTRLIYRSADFSQIKVPQSSDHSVSYSKQMQTLSKTLNRLKIAMHDDFYSQAIKHIEPLQKHLKDLSVTCGDCHNYPPKEQPKAKINYIFGSTEGNLATLKQALEQKQNKKARISLGTFAVNVCARCHSAHRTSSDLREFFE